MAAESTSYFLCVRCGEARRSTDVRYDALGYPKCPACGACDCPHDRRGGRGEFAGR